MIKEVLLTCEEKERSQAHVCKLSLNYRVANMKYNETFNAYGEEVEPENGCIYFWNTLTYE